MMKYNQEFGKWGEAAAAEYLKDHGLIIVEKNWKCSYGEIDIIALKEQLWVFVEVKTRKDDKFGLPEGAITRKKKEHLIHASMAYIEEHQIRDDWRIDILSIQKSMDIGIQIEWFENAIRENE
jgi:putative endonuclease